MNRKAFKTCVALLATALGLLAGPAGAQSPPSTTNQNGDWPNLGAFNNRQGQNANPTAYGSGRTNLRWRTEGSSYGQQATLFLDNTSFTDTTGFVGGPYEPTTAYGQVDAPQPNAAAWPGPADLNSEASDPYTLARRNYVLTIGTTNYPVDTNARVPAYNYALCTPSKRGTSATYDPRVPTVPADLKTWTWEFDPPTTFDGGVQNYAVYTWLPTGGTIDGGTRKFPHRYFVYEILYGNGQSFVDVVDTAITGGGFVRLGGGNGNNSTVFPWDNVHPIYVKLYNTIPRLNNVLAINGVNSGTSDARELSLSHNYLVYADACEARPQNGSFLASPTAATWTPGTFDTIDWQVTVARNSYISNAINGKFSQTTNGTLVSYEANPLLWTGLFTPLEKWNYSVVGESVNATNLDDPGPGVTFSGPWSAPTTGNHIGSTHHQILAQATETGTGTYAPTLADGDYAIYVYLPGTTTYATNVTYRIYSGTTVVDTVTLDQSTRAGWVRLGAEYYAHDATNATLHVEIANIDPVTAEQNTRYVFADAMRFVSPTSISVNSTPVHATVNIKQADGTLVLTKVVIAADESGKIHCLDMRGNGDGTTTEYWTYPTTVPEGNTAYADPNLSEGIDGVINPAVSPVSANVPTATMPASFDLSTAAIATFTDAMGQTYDRLYIASTNGRVYCLDMAGRGDWDKTTRKIGTTTRQWTYPNDYDPTSPTAAIPTSSLGAVRGSLVLGNLTTNSGTVYVPARQGRVYALKALGTTAELAQRRTSRVWVYPALNKPTLPSIVMTPTLAFGNLYFGTLRSPVDAYPGQFFALNATNGKLVWRFDGTTVVRTFSGATSVGSDVTRLIDPTDATQGRVDVGDFITGPAAVAGTELNSGSSATQADTVYALNQNAYLYGFNAATGAIIANGVTNSDGTARRYESNELAALAYGNLTYTRTTEYNNSGALTTDVPVIVVPGEEGILHRAYARIADFNVFEGLTAGYNVGLGTTLTSAAAANNTLFTANAEGVLYAFDDTVNSANVFNPAVAGGQQGIPPNDPRGLRYRSLRIKLVTRAAYLQLRTRNTDNEGNLTYDEVANTTTWDRPAPPSGQRQYAFEWGETAYILVYHFPFTTTNSATPPQSIAPPQINVTLTIEGKVARTRGITAQKFKGGTGDAVTDSSGSYTADGYAIYPFTFQGGGAMSLPPGNGVITASISTAAYGGSTSTTAIDISQDPRSTSLSRIPFIMANPLALIVEETVGGAVYGIATSGLGNAMTGTIDPYDFANRINGSPDLATTNNYYENQLLATAGFAQHGTTVTARAYIVDRSLMALIRPEGRSIENLRVTRSNLDLIGGVRGLYRLLDPALYPNWEDLPVDASGDIKYPNDSLDYPGIGRENILAVTNPETEPDNPLLGPVNLLPPLSTLAGHVGEILTEDNQDAGNKRTTRRTPLNMVIDVPRYQPPVNVFGNPNMTVGPLATDDPEDLLYLRREADGNTPVAQGYFGRVSAFIDSTGDGKLTLDQREAYRAFNLSLGVLPQVTILTGAPNVDLGALASGTGYAPVDPSALPPLTHPFDPWNGLWSSEYKPFSVRNDGNVNLLHLRISKGGNAAASGTYSVAENQPWQIVPSDNDPNAWMSGGDRDASGLIGAGSLWSNIDATFAAPNPRTGNASLKTAVILPKPRVTDRQGAELVANPAPRANPNTGATGTTGYLNPSYTTTTPKIGISVPLGFPVGNYTSRVRVFEDYADFDTSGPRGAFDQVLNYFPDLQTSEAYSDPITVSFKVRETRLTNNATPLTAPIVDPNLLPTTTTSLASAYRNGTPAAMRGTNGDVVVAWPSDRPNASPTNSTAMPPTKGRRLYLAGLVQSRTKDQDPAPAYNSPLWDLSQFDQTGNTWFAKSTAYPNGYPTNPGALFKDATSETVDDTLTDFGAPSFPLQGDTVPYDGTGNLSTRLMAFVGAAEVQTGTGRVTKSKVFVTSVTGRGAGLNASAPIATKDDPLTSKGKPSIVQFSSGNALVFYPATSAGQTGINVSRYVGGGSASFGLPYPLDFGGGFTSVNSPSVGTRAYRRASGGSGPSQPILDVSFAGKLRGRANAEVYLGRMFLSTTDNSVIVDSTGRALGSQGAGNGFALLPVQTRERLVGEGGGLYRARGVAWSRTTGITLEQTLSGSLVPLLVGNPTIDRQSGLVVYDSRLGGKVYFDPNLGTARFVGSAPSVNAEIRLTYTPTFLRVTPGGTAAYSSVNALYDGRYVSERNYWFSTDAVNSYGNVANNVPLRNDRYFFTYGRGATGGGVTARPYSLTWRLGLRLPTRASTLEDGRIVAVKVGGNAYPYQVDAPNGRLYFQAEDEGKTVTVQYTGVDEATNGPITVNVSGVVSYVLERDESPVPVDEATNDSAICAFLDPFTYAGVPRPPLVWLFYVSTRAGAPDVYFQTIAPRLTPFAK